MQASYRYRSKCQKERWSAQDRSKEPYEQNVLEWSGMTYTELKELAKDRNK